MSDTSDPVLVTGANSGFGLASVLRFADRGWDTWGTVRSEAKAEIVRQAAEAAGVADRVTAVVLDVSDHTAVVEAWPDMPPFYAVVNNAGYSELGAVEDVTADQAKRILDVNLVAPAVVSQCALPAMRDRGSGRIVMMSSMFGRAAVVPLQGWYHASKFGLEALSDVLRMEVASFGVKVSVIEPGFFKTDIEDGTRERAAELDADGDSPYARAYRMVSDTIDSTFRFAPPADIVARLVVSAVEARWPLRRYVVGADAAALVTAAPLVPRPLLDIAGRFMSGLGPDPLGRDDR